MKNIQVKNIPDSLHKKIWNYAKRSNSTLSEFILSAISHEMERLEWTDKLNKRPSTNLGVSAASLLEEERKERTGLSD